MFEYAERSSACRRSRTDANESRPCAGWTLPLDLGCKGTRLWLERLERGDRVMSRWMQIGWRKLRLGEGWLMGNWRRRLVWLDEA